MPTPSIEKRNGTRGVGEQEGGAEIGPEVPTPQHPSEGHKRKDR